MIDDRLTAQVVKLEQERVQSLQEMAYLAETFQVEVDLDLDEADPNLIEREKAIVMIEDLKRKLGSIDHALRQIKRGGYGICERCKQPIDPARLEIMPEATLCVPCKIIVERRGY